MMRRAVFIAVLALAGCNPQGVKQIGVNQYVVTGDWTHRFPKARATCARVHKKPLPLDAPLDTTQFKFECLSSYDIEPANDDTYRIRVFSGDMPLKSVLVSSSPPMTVHLPDAEPADKEARQRATNYCMKMGRTLQVLHAEFETGAGLSITFRCAPPGASSP